MPELASRPDGSFAKIVGVIFAILGGIAWIIAFSMSTTQYSFGGDIDPDKLAMKGALTLVAGGLLQLGVIIWLAGYIVSAISFLPGKDD